MSLVPYFLVTITSKAKITALTAVSVENASIRNAWLKPELAAGESITKFRVAAVAISSMLTKTLRYF